LALCLTACQSGPFVWARDVSARSLPPQASDLIRVNDIVEVLVFEQEKMSVRSRVPPTGKIAIPLLGEVAVLGKAPADVAKLLSAELRRFVNDPRVTVVILETRVSVTAVGQLKSTGILDLERPATVLQAIAKAGGLNEFASRSQIYVIRSGNAQERRIRFSYDDLVEGEPASTRFLLENGDVLVVE
ncbi:MAG TPA: polysaccharide biosynthesis/export family protein, partial [Polyangiales bacterium]